MGSQCGPVPDGMSVASNLWPSMVPPILTARLVPSSSAESGMVTNVAKAPSLWSGAVKVWSSGAVVVLMGGSDSSLRGRYVR